VDTDLIKQRCAILEPFLDERLRRLYAAAEAKALGYGGVSAVARATGVSRGAIASGLQEIHRHERPSQFGQPGVWWSRLAFRRPI